MDKKDYETVDNCRLLFFAPQKLNKNVYINT